MLPLILFLLATPLLASDAWSRSYLNNEGLVLLARAGYGERFLLELVATQPSRFDTSVEGLVFLAKNGMSEKMVRSVIAAKKKAEAEEDAPEAAHTPTHAPAHGQHPTSAPAAPVRLKAVRQTVLVPENMARSTAGRQILLLDPKLVELR